MTTKLGVISCISRLLMLVMSMEGDSRGTNFSKAQKAPMPTTMAKEMMPRLI